MLAAEMLGEALDYARRGWAVFPLHTPTQGGCSCRNPNCASIGKHPRTAQGLKAASLDPGRVAQWWAQWPEANIGIVCGAVSGLVVLDVDGPEGEDTLEALEAELGPLPETIEAMTGKGRHLYFKHPGGRVRSSVGALGPKLDVRGDGSYVVGPESLHHTGRRYIWEATHGPEDAPLAELPGAWIERLRPEAGTLIQRRLIEGVPELLDSNMSCIKAAAYGVPEGHRNFWLGRITKYLQIRYPEERAWQIVLAWNRLCRPAEKVDRLSADFKAYWHGPYKLLGCIQGDASKQAMLAAYCAAGDCERGGTMGRLELDDAVSINNRIFGAYHEWTGNELIVFGILLRHPEGLTTSALLEKLTARATGKPCMALNTMRQCLATLARRGLIRIIERNRQAGRENFFRAIPQGTYGRGYTLVTNGAIIGAVAGMVTPGEFRLYVLLLKFAYCKGACYPSLATLSKELRTDVGPISRQLKSLEKADYIKRFYGYEGNDCKLIFRLLV